MATGRTRVPEIRKGDTVLVLSGKDAGKQGVVERVITNKAANLRVTGSRDRQRSPGPPRLLEARLEPAGRGRRRGAQHREAPHQAAPDPGPDRPRPEGPAGWNPRHRQAA